ncbi:C40 family peptidase [Treponema sp. OMZ 840]|uniref:C40 family peptidase n=1 Tax=Treponema sp. OMZ 840 TaxID=244313 RepID=UPI003D93757A
MKLFCLSGNGSRSFIRRYRPLIFFVLLCLFCTSSLSAQTAPAPEASDTSSAQVLRAKVIRAAKQYVGVPYRYGGISVSGMDCSGFIYTVAREAAQVQLPRTAAAMYSFCRIVNDAQKEPGDILFFRDGGKITHAGLYIGNNQFIHAVSDGPNTGVIVSSLNQTTWKQKYAGCGQFLPSAKTAESQPKSPDTKEKVNQRQPAAGSNLLNDVLFDFSGHVKWTVYAADRFDLHIRGAGFQAHIRYSRWPIQPGLAFEFRLEPLMHIYQFPLLLTASIPHGFRFYGGPVFTVGSAHLIGKSDSVYASVFPGVFGIGWQSPGLQVDKSKISFTQDISWSAFYKPDKAALNFKDSIASSLSFSTGVRVTISAKDLFS